ncbi:MAG: hypothetical protein Q9227_006866 [Pyrenula ochraceoflavens]
MTTVSSLDKDLRQMRLEKYTPKAANEVRTWIEESLGERLSPGDLLEALKDGVALCKLVNMAVSPGVKYKQSAMPFVQMENISHFLRACQVPPISLPPHDVFLTVDLYEAKDPAQVLQCIGAFSRRANALQPTRFPTTIGAKSRGGIMSPQMTGNSQSGVSSPTGIFPPSRDRGTSNASESAPTAWNPLAKGSYASGRISPTKSPTKNGGPGSPPSGVSAWTKRGDEDKSAPAWNIHQYGYMGGANQGNLGVAYGARRQITSAAPTIPSLAEKERKRKEEAAEAERLRLQQEEAEQIRLRELEAEEERARQEEERRWEEETQRARERERLDAEAEKRKWQEEQQRWKEEEDARAREDREVEARFESERTRKRGNSNAQLNGQFLSQYQAEQGRKSRNVSGEQRVISPESQRIQDLERQLELAKEREKQYELERQERQRRSPPRSEYRRNRSKSRSRPALPSRPPEEHEDQNAEREYLQNEWQSQQPPPQPPRPNQASDAPVQVKKNNTGPSARPLPEPRPLPDPNAYPSSQNRTDRYLSSNPAPAPFQPASHRPTDYSTTTEVDLENERRKASQAKTKAAGWASKSLLEREMERERERQREWEEGQKQTESAARDRLQGSKPGQSWDVHQYGYMGGDSQNRGGSGLGVSGARRQIIGPRPPP